ncbi:MAG: hypothetical protein WCJ69_04225 [Betaproteobacteria bacterium]|jgi:hypothetical protein
MMMSGHWLGRAVLAIALIGTGGLLNAADLERGTALHDTFCMVCHSPAVYTREDRIANSYLEIRQQVERWQANAKLRWSQGDIDAVTELLADRYYRAAR